MVLSLGTHVSNRNMYWGGVPQWLITKEDPGDTHILLSNPSRSLPSQTLHLGLLLLIQLPYSLVSYQHHRAFSTHEALGYLRQISLLVGCHDLNTCFFQNSYVENLIFKVVIIGGGTIGKWLGHEGRAHMNRIRALVKEVWNAYSSLLFRDMSWKRPALTEPCWHPDLGLLSSRTATSNVVYKQPSLWHFVTAACMH